MPRPAFKQVHVKGTIEYEIHELYLKKTKGLTTCYLFDISIQVVLNRE